MLHTTVKWPRRCTSSLSAQHGVRRLLSENHNRFTAVCTFREGWALKRRMGGLSMWVLTEDQSSAGLCRPWAS